MKTGKGSIFFGLIIVLVIPIIIAILMEFSIVFEVEVSNDWIGFYASYLGSIIGVLGVFAVMRIDQRKRDEERNDNLFLNNIDLYRKVANALNVSTLNNLNMNVNALIKEEKWNLIDTTTKGRIKAIMSVINYYNESSGLYSMIERFIKNHLYDELKVTMHSNRDEYNDGFEYEEIPDVVIQDISNVIRNCSNIDLEYENSFEIDVTQEILLERFEKQQYSKGYSEQMDSIYSKLNDLGNSNEWNEYVSRRTSLFKRVSDLKKDIDTRIERLLMY